MLPLLASVAGVEVRRFLVHQVHAERSRFSRRGAVSPRVESGETPRGGWSVRQLNAKLGWVRSQLSAKILQGLPRQVPKTTAARLHRCKKNTWSPALDEAPLVAS